MMNQIFTETLPVVSPERIFSYLQRKKNFVWLDSSLKSAQHRYSLMAFDPFLIFKSKKDRVTVKTESEEKKYSGDPLLFLDDFLDRYRIKFPSFFGPAAVGYFSYDLMRQMENIPETSVDDLNIPDIWLGFYNSIILFDHIKKKMFFISVNPGGKRKFFEKEFLRQTEKLKVLFRKAGDNEFQSEKGKIDIKDLRSNMSYAGYRQAIKKIKNYIAAGDVYQINFAQRIEAEGTFTARKIYSGMRKINPTGFSGFINAGNFQILCNSPELFLKKEGNRIFTRPMKGTAARGKSVKQDEMYRKKLLASAKDTAELIMIVDMERNDIGRICKPGTVKVKKLKILEEYKTVFQTTSLVEGQLFDNLTFGDLLKATFPGGSITGAPKIRAMEIIEELEPCKRSFYTGSMGYLGFNGNIELNIMIRTALLKKNRLFYPVGGGIVWDSTAEKEYRETLTKAESFFLTIGKNEKNLPV
jgi:para-aminobenzoate synthetase component I